MFSFLCLVIYFFVWFFKLHFFIYVVFYIMPRIFCIFYIVTCSSEGRGNQNIQLINILYCKLPTNSKQLPAFPLQLGPEFNFQPQSWEASVLPLFHRYPFFKLQPGNSTSKIILQNILRVCIYRYH